MYVYSHSYILLSINNELAFKRHYEGIFAQDALEIALLFKEKCSAGFSGKTNIVSHMVISPNMINIHITYAHIF